MSYTKGSKCSSDSYVFPDSYDIQAENLEKDIRMAKAAITGTSSKSRVNFQLELFPDDDDSGNKDPAAEFLKRNEKPKPQVATRSRDESPESRKARKKAVKAIQAEKREVKKKKNTKK